jgi:hypothetical protein
MNPHPHPYLKNYYPFSFRPEQHQPCDPVPDFETIDQILAITSKTNVNAKSSPNLELYQSLRMGIGLHYSHVIEPIEKKVLFNPGDPGYKGWVSDSRFDRTVSCGGRRYDVKYGFAPTRVAHNWWSTPKAPHELTESNLLIQLKRWTWAVGEFEKCIRPLSYTMPKDTHSAGSDPYFDNTRIIVDDRLKEFKKLPDSEKTGFQWKYTTNSDWMGPF